MEHGPGTPESLISRHLTRLQADPQQSSVLSAYIAALTDEAGLTWLIF